MDKTTREESKTRLEELMELTGLERPGFAKFVGVSENHLYSLISGRRRLTEKLANEIGKKLEFDGYKIMRQTTEFPDKIKRSKALREFYSNYKDNPEYFISTKIGRKTSHFIESELFPTGIFNSPAYVWEVKDKCKMLKKELTSDEISKHLKYFVKKGMLMSEKRRIKRRDGKEGKRIVDVFWKKA